MPCALQADLGRAQEALKAARAESARRLRDLQQLQVQQQPAPGAGSPAGLAQQLEVETAAREAAEAKLRDAKAGLARHKQMVSDLRKKVSTLCVRAAWRCRLHSSNSQLQLLKSKSTRLEITFNKLSLSASCSDCIRCRRIQWVSRWMRWESSW